MRQLRCILESTDQLTHDGDYDISVEFLNGDTQQEEPDRELNEAYGEEIKWLCDEVEFSAFPEVNGIDVFDMPSCAVINLWNNDSLAGYTL